MKQTLQIFILIILTIKFKCIAKSKHDEIKIHVCTIASQAGPGLERLLDTCEQQNIRINILGYGRPYPGNGQKLVYIKEYVKNLPSKDVVLFVDGYDVLFLANTKTILQKFLSYRVPFVISTEKNCYPFPNLATQYPRSPTNSRYINSGGFIGYAGFIRKMLNKIEIQPAIPDQGQLTRYFLENKFPFFLDYFSEIFLSLFNVKRREIELDPITQKVHYVTTNTYPCIIHNNGSKNSFSGIYKEIYEMRHE